MNNIKIAPAACVVNRPTIENKFESHLKYHVHKDFIAKYMKGDSKLEEKIKKIEVSTESMNDDFEELAITFTHDKAFEHIVYTDYANGNLFLHFFTNEFKPRDLSEEEVENILNVVLPILYDSSEQLEGVH